MNSHLNNTSQFSNDNDVFAYRGQAARLRSEAVRSLFSHLLGRGKTATTQDSAGCTKVNSANCQAV